MSRGKCERQPQQYREPRAAVVILIDESGHPLRDLGLLEPGEMRLRPRVRIDVGEQEEVRAGLRAVADAPGCRVAQPTR